MPFPIFLNSNLLKAVTKTYSGTAAANSTSAYQTTVTVPDGYSELVMITATINNENINNDGCRSNGITGSTLSVRGLVTNRYTTSQSYTVTIYTLWSK